MNLNHLMLVDGHPIETITVKLKEAGFDYILFPKKTEPYFRYHRIYIKTMPNKKWEENREAIKGKIREILGFPNNYKSGDYYYYARYKTRPSFNISELDKRVTFSNGLLVESTAIGFC